MNAEILAIGSEMLTPTRVDTNSLFLTDQLNALGVEVVAKHIIGDDRARLVAAIRTALAASEIVILTGGLGPTEDDLTRESVAEATGRKLIFEQALLDPIIERFRRYGRQMSENNRRQAERIDGAEILPNPNGTAVGQFLRHEDRVIALLPGPPRELEPMVRDHFLPRLRELLPPVVLRTLHWRVTGLGEGEMDSLIAPIYTRYPQVATTILAHQGDLQIHLRARMATAEEGDVLLREMADQMAPLLTDKLYTQEGKPLEAVIGDKLLARNATVCTAESITGGIVAQRLTDVPGSSQYCLGGIVAYTEGLKQALLGVDAALLAEHGAVSEPVARAMAEGARARTGASYAVATTGFAGPTGGTEREPVGTVYVAVATPEAVTVERRRFVNERTLVRAVAAQWALDLLRRAMR